MLARKPTCVAQVHDLNLIRMPDIYQLAGIASCKLETIVAEENCVYGTVRKEENKIASFNSYSELVCLCSNRAILVMYREPVPLPVRLRQALS